MKKFKLFFLFACISVFIIACKKGDTGPAGATGAAGPAGETGPQGPAGVEGNANVTLYNYAGADFAATSLVSLLVPTTEDSMNRSAFFVYLHTSSKLTYPIPGVALNGASAYRAYWYFTTPNVTFVISRLTGPGEAYDSIRIVRILASDVKTESVGAKSSLPDIDFNDYHVVAKYYNLRD